MPFTKVGNNKYTSPSGRKFTKKQVMLYYATDGFKKTKNGGLKNYGKSKISAS
jgi:hypothetical protein